MITNGYNTGITQYFGRMIHKAKLKNPKQNLIAIGICKWGSIRNVKKLTDLNGNRRKVQHNIDYLYISKYLL